jgi:putative ABC transport system permease protein
MVLPIHYNLRNLVVRRTTTLLTVSSISLSSAVLVADLALVEGLKAAFQATGDPSHVLVLRKGSRAEVTSDVSRATFQDLRFSPGVAENGHGEPMASLELVTVINLASVDSPRGMNVTLRGVTSRGIGMRNVTLAEGQWFDPGRRQVVVGTAVAKRYPDARLSGTLRFGKGEWEVVGVFDAGESAFGSEIWGDLEQLSSDFNRQDHLSSVLLLATDAAAVRTLVHSLESDPRLNVSVLSEPDYYQSQTVSGAPLQYLGLLIAAIMAVGSSFAAMNTMYAAVSRRAREVGTLRVLGFSRASILTSFLVESLLLSLVGGLVGGILALPLSRFSTGVGNFATFSEIAFRFHVGASSIAAGVVFAMMMGVAGGLFPARRAARREILDALREV